MAGFGFAIGARSKSWLSIRVAGPRLLAEGDFGLPFCIDWLPDGRLLVVAGRRHLLLRREQDGSWTTHADLGGISTGAWNEIVVDGRGNIYVNGGSGNIALVLTL
jgi:sugar lactone lactonase YvrE